MKFIHIDLPNSVYWYQLHNAGFDSKSKNKIIEHIKKNNFNKILIFGSNNATGKAIKNIIAPYFYGFINSDTIDQTMKLTFDSIIIASSPRHYSSILKKIRENINIPNATVITIFKDDPYHVQNNDHQYLTPVPCHTRTLFVRFNGDIFPCCQVWMREDLKIGNISDGDITQRFRNFDRFCTCKNTTLRPLTSDEKTDVFMIAFELSLVCNAKCAMCCAHSPEYTKEYGLSKNVVNYKAIERTIELLNPKYLMFQGGEVLINDYEIEWLKKLRKKHEHIHFWLTTNGNVSTKKIDDVYNIFNSYYIDFYGFQNHTYKTITGLELNRVIEFSKELLKLDSQKVFLKYLTTPINLHESTLFFEWALKCTPNTIVIRDANSDKYINYKKGFRIPQFSAYGNIDSLPNMYWNRIINRTIKRLNSIYRNNVNLCEEKGIKIHIDGGLLEMNKDKLSISSSQYVSNQECTWQADG